LVSEVKRLLLDHLLDHGSLYGGISGVRTARKHIAWYVKALPGGEVFRARMNLLDDAEQQHQAVADYFDELAQATDRLPVQASVAGDEHPQEEMEETSL
jgi:tRNA-dihydrouridine synthase B